MNVCNISFLMDRLKPVSSPVNRASAIETVDSGSIPSDQTKHFKNWDSQLSCLTFSNKQYSVKLKNETEQ